MILTNQYSKVEHHLTVISNIEIACSFRYEYLLCDFLAITSMCQFSISGGGEEKKRAPKVNMDLYDERVESISADPSYIVGSSFGSLFTTH